MSFNTERKLGRTEGLGVERFALLMDAQIKLRKEECASDTVQRPNDAAVMGAQTYPGMEECAAGMGQNTNVAATKDA